MDEKERKPEIKPIRPFVIQFSTDEEEEEFYKWLHSDTSDSESAKRLKRARKLYKEHTQAQRRKKGE
ncbi:hypothetical protein 000TH009_232 [Bacillus phage 000TH009]|nr:hypothetical protein 000TH009_232 [Bacillus phage 000TH009]